MTTWNGWTLDGSYGLRIERIAMRELDRMCRDTGDTETGGILVGVYSPDRAVAIVREATAPPSDSRRGHSWFKRGVEGLRELLAHRWRATNRTHYLGEWHFHPAQVVVPSSRDFSQMVQIAHATDYHCKEPVLVILGFTEHSGARPLRAFVCPMGETPKEILPMKSDPSSVPKAVT
jgi:integrative and conjugative element protein (TIGR02256 family)